jgi:hypothetical protein
VIGAGTMKTHTLNLYRKLVVANRAQALGLLRARPTQIYQRICHLGDIPTSGELLS